MAFFDSVKEFTRLSLMSQPPEIIAFCQGLTQSECTRGSTLAAVCPPRRSTWSRVARWQVVWS